MKRLTALGLASTMVLSMAGCGNSGTKTATEGAVTEATEATAAAETTADTSGDDTESAENSEAEPVTLSITWWGGQVRHDYTQQLLDKYTELNPHVTFEAMPSGWDGYFDKLSTQAASGSMPDIVQMDYLYISTYAQNNSVADLQEFIDNGTIDVSNIDENLLNTGKINDKMAGMVLSTSLLAVGYNPDVLTEAGVDVPTGQWTWSDFVAMNQAVKDATGKMGSASGPVDDTNLFNYWVRQKGGVLFSEDNKSLGYDDDSIMASYLQLWMDMIEAGTNPNPDEFAAIQTLGQEGGPVVTGESAMTFEWNNYASKLSEVNGNLKMVTPPLSDDSENKGLWMKPGMFFTVSETSEVKEEAARFINWFVNSEEANDIIMAERGTPVSSVVREYLSNAGNMTPQQEEMFEYVDLAEELCGETPAPDPVGMSEINEAFNNAAYSAFYGQITPEAAAAQFREEANAILERNN